MPRAKNKTEMARHARRSFDLGISSSPSFCAEIQQLPEASEIQRYRYPTTNGWVADPRGPIKMGHSWSLQGGDKPWRIALPAMAAAKKYFLISVLVPPSQSFAGDFSRRP